MDAPGVEYFEIEAGGQAIRLFACPRYKCDISPASCAARFTGAQNLTDKAGMGHPAYECKHCVIGAQHAGVQSLKPKRQAACVRCGQWAHKLVRGLLCVSCFNRQSEVLKGKDRRGHPPKVTIKFWDTGPAREPKRIPAVFNIAVLVEGIGVRVYPATRPREALEMASREYFKGRPLRLAVVNAAELGRQIPRHCHNATHTIQSA